MYLERLRWPDVKELDFSQVIVLLPLGSIEQHGLHLPLNTDSAIITALAKSLEERTPKELLVAPTLWCGHSTHHLAFPGTLSLTQDHYSAIIADTCRSLISAGARKLFLFNGHGGNDIPARYAMREIKSLYPNDPGLRVVFASYWHLAREHMDSVRESQMGGMGHACEMETSMMLFLHPDLVDMSRAKQDGPAQIPPYRQGDMLAGSPVYEVQDFHELSETGTCGACDLASAEKGERFFSGIIDSVSTFLKDFRTW
jgi:creatinine amidohydrolase